MLRKINFQYTQLSETFLFVIVNNIFISVSILYRLSSSTASFLSSKFEEDNKKPATNIQTLRIE
jgi:hypothetical protein